MALRVLWRDVIQSFVPGSQTDDQTSLVNFAAKDLVDFLVGCGRCISRSAALELCETLRRRDIIRPSQLSYEGKFSDNGTRWTCRAGEDAFAAASFSPAALLCTSSYVMSGVFGKQGMLMVNPRLFVLDRGTARLYVYTSEYSSSPRYYVDLAGQECSIRLLTPSSSLPTVPADGDDADTDTEGEDEDCKDGANRGAQAKGGSFLGLKSSTQSWGFVVTSPQARIAAYTQSERRARVWTRHLAAAAAGLPCTATVSHYQQKLSKLAVAPPMLLPPSRPSVGSSRQASAVGLGQGGAMAMGTGAGAANQDRRLGQEMSSASLAAPFTGPTLARTVAELLSTPHERVRALVPPDWAATYASALPSAIVAEGGSGEAEAEDRQEGMGVLTEDAEDGGAGGAGSVPGPTLPPWADVPESVLSDESGPACPARLTEAYTLPLDTYCRVVAQALELGSGMGMGGDAGYGSYASPSKSSPVDLRPLRLLVLEPGRLATDLGIFVPAHARALLERCASLVPLLPFEEDGLLSEGIDPGTGQANDEHEASLGGGWEGEDTGAGRRTDGLRLSRGASLAQLTNRSPSVAKGLRLARENSQAALRRQSSSPGVRLTATSSLRPTSPHVTQAGPGGGRAGQEAYTTPGRADNPYPSGQGSMAPLQQPLFEAQRQAVLAQVMPVLRRVHNEDNGARGPGRTSRASTAFMAGGSSRSGRNSADDAAAALASRLLPTKPATVHTGSTWAGTQGAAGRVEMASPKAAGSPAQGTVGVEDPILQPLASSSDPCVLPTSVCESWAVALVRMANSMTHAQEGQAQWRRALARHGGGKQHGAGQRDRSGSSAGAGAHATGPLSTRVSGPGPVDLEAGLAAWSQQSKAAQASARRRASSADRYEYGLGLGLGSALDDMSSTGDGSGKARRRSSIGGVPRSSSSVEGAGPAGVHHAHAHGHVHSHGHGPGIVTSEITQTAETLCALLRSLMTARAVHALTHGDTAVGHATQVCSAALQAVYGREVAPRLGVVLAPVADSDLPPHCVSASAACGLLKEDVQLMVTALAGSVTAWAKTWSTALADWASTGLYMRATASFEARTGLNGDAAQAVWRRACRILRALALPDKEHHDVGLTALQRALFSLGSMDTSARLLYRGAFAHDDASLALATALLAGITTTQLDLPGEFRVDGARDLAVVLEEDATGQKEWQVTTVAELAGQGAVHSAPASTASTAPQLVCQPCTPWLPARAVLPLHLSTCASLDLPMRLCPLHTGQAEVVASATGISAHGTAATSAVVPFPGYAAGTAASPAAQVYLQGAVELLILLPTLPSPVDRTRCLVSLVDVLCRMVTLHRLAAHAAQGEAAQQAPHGHGKNKGLDAAHITADDLLGLLCATAVAAMGRKAGLCLASELPMLADLCGEESLVERQGFYLTSLQAALMYSVSGEVVDRLACGHCEDKGSKPIVHCAACGRQLCKACDMAIHGTGPGMLGHVRVKLEDRQAAGPSVEGVVYPLTTTAVPVAGQSIAERFRSSFQSHTGSTSPGSRTRSRSRTFSNAATAKWLAVGVHYAQTGSPGTRSGRATSSASISHGSGHK